MFGWHVHTTDYSGTAPPPAHSKKCVTWVCIQNHACFQNLCAFRHVLVFKKSVFSGIWQHSRKSKLQFEQLSRINVSEDRWQEAHTLRSCRYYIYKNNSLNSCCVEMFLSGEEVSILHSRFGATQLFNQKSSARACRMRNLHAYAITAVIDSTVWSLKLAKNINLMTLRSSILSVERHSHLLSLEAFLCIRVITIITGIRAVILD